MIAVSYRCGIADETEIGSLVLVDLRVEDIDPDDCALRIETVDPEFGIAELRADDEQHVRVPGMLADARSAAGSTPATAA
jgi:hypothetical protein